MLYLKLEYGLPIIITSDIENKDMFDLVKAKGIEFTKKLITIQIVFNNYYYLYI